MANQVLDNANQRQTKLTEMQTNFSAIQTKMTPNPFLSNLKQECKPFVSSSKPAFNSVQTVCKPMPNQARNLKPRSASLYSAMTSMIGYCLAPGRLDDQWRLASASSQDRLPQKCVIQAAAMAPGTLPEPHTIRIVAIRAPASGARTRHSSCKHG